MAQNQDENKENIDPATNDSAVRRINFSRFQIRQPLEILRPSQYQSNSVNTTHPSGQLIIVPQNQVLVRVIFDAEEETVTEFNIDNFWQELANQVNTDTSDTDSSSESGDGTGVESEDVEGELTEADMVWQNILNDTIERLREYTPLYPLSHYESNQVAEENDPEA